MTAFSCSPLKMGLPPWQQKCIPFLTVLVPQQSVAHIGVLPAMILDLTNGVVG